MGSAEEYLLTPWESDSHSKFSLSAPDHRFNSLALCLLTTAVEDVMPKKGTHQLQEPSRAMLMERPGFESPEVISEEISAENLPVWIMVLCASSVVLSALFGGLFYRRNYVVKPHFDMDD